MTNTLFQAMDTSGRLPKNNKNKQFYNLSIQTMPSRNKVANRSLFFQADLNTLLP